MDNSVTAPKTMWISLTDICNNKCIWCYEEGNHSEKIKYIERNTVNKILDTMCDVGIKKCILIGGEPTLHPELYEIIDDVKKKNLSISMVTNGRQFSNVNTVKKIKKAKINLVLSVHGWSDETYFKFTQAKHGFSDLKKSIRFLQEYEIKFGINIVLSKHTINEIDNIIDFILWSGLPQAAFNIASPVVSKGGVDSSFVTEMKDYRTQIMEIYHKCKGHGVKANFLLIIPHCVFTNDELTQLAESQSIISGCQVLHGNGVVFKTNGAIATCTHLSDFEIADKYTAENILESANNFLTYWNSEELVLIRQKANYYRSDECSKCSHWTDCGGGCLVHWAYHNPLTVNLRHM